MKQYKISLFALAAALLTTACNDMDEQYLEGGSITPEQLLAANVAVPSRVDASFVGMYGYMWAGGSGRVITTQNRADDFGMIMSHISLSLEGADAFGSDNGYNWFSTASEYSDRDPNYANPFIRYTTPYRQAGVANGLINSLGDILASAPGDTVTRNKLGQAYAIRAFDYLSLAPYFAGNYAGHKNDLCIPMLSTDENFDATNNPRATVEKVYEQIISDLDNAIEYLKGYKRNITAEDASQKQYIDRNVAFGLRARANLFMENWQAAADDADSAMVGYTPASMKDVSVPAFCNLKEKNWMWGVLITEDQASNNWARNPSAWVSAFSGEGYAPATTNVPCINVLLYNKIPVTDVRKQWWLDATLHSDAWANLVWTDPKTGKSAKGDDIAKFTDKEGNKVEFLPYTSIKFAQKGGVANTVNNNDWPLMRVEEMILIKAEGLAKAGNEADARTTLENFVKNFRDPSYSSTAGGRTLADEIWYQRRVELWMEGFDVADARRLNKPIVRFHADEESNVPDAFKFNIKADDPWLNMRFPQDEVDANHGIVDNEGGTQPKPGQNPELRDGVTD